MGLNERIMQLRKQAGWTQEQLGEKLGVSRQAVSKWEAGQANPDVTYLAEMCRLFGVSSDWLLLGKGGPAPNGAAEEKQAESYCLYLASGASWATAEHAARLFEFPWAKPAFPWAGGPMDAQACYKILEDAPMVLCRGLTHEEAVKGAEVFCTTPGVVQIYREKDLESIVAGQERPAAGAEPVSDPKPMGPGMVFLMVVLGVIAALFIMSLL